jgi:hypothetical protein
MKLNFAYLFLQPLIVRLCRAGHYPQGRRGKMQKNLVVVAALGVMLQTASAESWNCQLSNHSGPWQTDGADILGPLMRYAIVRDTPDALVGLSDPIGGRMDMVVLNRRSLVMQTLSVGLDGDVGPRDTGRCARAETVRGETARGETSTSPVRPVIRSLARQAQNLATQGFTTAANLKLVEAEGERRLTPEENRLIAQVRAYIATKPRR